MNRQKSEESIDFFFFESEFSNVDNVFNISRILIVRIVILNDLMEYFRGFV